MNGYMTCKEASKKWGVSERQVQAYCKNGTIPQVSRIELDHPREHTETSL